MIFIDYKDFKALKNAQFGAMAGQIHRVGQNHIYIHRIYMVLANPTDTAYGCSKSRVHAAAE